MHSFYVIFFVNVQGVGFRMFVRDVALRYGLRGVVWNMKDVEKVGAIFEHEDAEAIFRAISYILLNSKNPYGRFVKRIFVERIDAKHYSDFRIVFNSPL